MNRNDNTPKPALSFTLIVKDEEKYIEGCLQSIQDIADEIVVLDTGSSDRTIEIVKRNNVKLHHFEWIGDFSAARNEALRYATGEWIFIIDADERLKIEEKEKFFAF